MKVTIIPSGLHGSVRAIESKSEVHRLLIGAALADSPTEILCKALSDDISATAESLNRIGADIHYEKKSGSFHVVPICRNSSGGNTGNRSCVPDVGESGSTLRFLLPLICALGVNAHIVMRGRLPERPLSPLWEELERHGCRLVRNDDGSIDTAGRLRGGEFRMAGNVSSQFISGLLFVLPLLEDVPGIRLYGPVESEAYIRMTMRAMEQFGIRTVRDGDVLRVLSGSSYHSPGRLSPEGDWSCGAFWEIAGMLTKGGREGLVCTGLDEGSIQRDRAVRELKHRIAAGGAVVDARNIPDLVPVLSVLAAVSPGSTSFIHAERLRLKESDRIRSTVRMLRALGGTAEETVDGLIVYGKERLSGGCADSCNDHRIAMSAAVASAACTGKVIIEGAEAVNKSYPQFWDDFERLGGKITREPSGHPENQ